SCESGCNWRLGRNSLPVGRGSAGASPFTRLGGSLALRAARREPRPPSAFRVLLHPAGRSGCRCPPGKSRSFRIVWRGTLGLGGGTRGNRDRDSLAVARLTRAFLFPEDNREFVAADAGHQVVLAAAALHQEGGLAQDLVAQGVAVLVVVFFEVVDVEEEQRD